jgi:hypothetical protein
MVSPRIPTSARMASVAVTTVPPRITMSKGLIAKLPAHPVFVSMIETI